MLTHAIIRLCWADLAGREYAGELVSRLTGCFLRESFLARVLHRVFLESFVGRTQERKKGRDASGAHPPFGPVIKLGIRHSNKKVFWALCGQLHYPLSTVIQLDIPGSCLGSFKGWVTNPTHSRAMFAVHCLVATFSKICRSVYSSLGTNEHDFGGVSRYCTVWITQHGQVVLFRLTTIMVS